MLAEDIFDPNPPGTDVPREGYYLWRRRERVDQPVRIWFGQPIDHERPGRLLERSWRWQMLVSGHSVPIFDFEREDRFDPVWTDIWPQCSGLPAHPDGPTSPRARAEYRYLLARIEHAQLNDPNDPFGSPGRKVDLRTATLPF